MTLLLWGRKAARPPPATRAVQSSRKRIALLKPCGTAALPTASEIRRWVNIHGFLIETPGDQINREVLAKQGTETNKQTNIGDSQGKTGKQGTNNILGRSFHPEGDGFEPQPRGEKAWRAERCGETEPVTRV